MAELTNPALELAELCEYLRGYPDHLIGEQVIAQHFNVDAQSAQFFQVVFLIIHRFEQLSKIVSELSITDSLKNEAENHIKTLAKAFSRDGLQNQWSFAKTQFLSPAFVGPVKFLSISLQSSFSYPRLSDEEINTLVTEVDEMLIWLNTHQLVEQDFFRAAIMDGLSLLRFRLERLRWLGWGYTISGLRDVIQAYLALGGTIANQNERPDGGAVLLKVKSFVSRFWQAARFTKEATETATFMVDAYGKLTDMSRTRLRTHSPIQKMTMAASVMAPKKVVAHRS